jgi:hypothetical protein
MPGIGSSSSSSIELPGASKRGVRVEDFLGSVGRLGLHD